MNIVDDANAVQLKKPGPLTRAAGGLSIDTTPTDPDTDGRRQYSPNAGQAFAYRPEVAGIASGMDSTATQSPATEPAPLSGIAAPVVPGSSPPAKGIAAITQPGRNAEGVITAESARDAMGSDMQRSGSVFGTMDMKGVNDIMGREKNARGEMMDSMIQANGGNGNIPAIQNAGIAAMTPEQRFKAAAAYDFAVDKATGVSSAGAQGVNGMTQRFESFTSNDEIRAMRNAREDLLGSGISFEKGANGQLSITNNGKFDPIAPAQGSTIDLAGQNERMAKSLGYEGVNDFNKKWRERSEYGTSIDSLDPSERANYELGKGRNEAATARLGIALRGQDITASTAADRIASQERIAEQRTDPGMRLSLPQVRSNREIDAARERIAGMDAAEIKRRTANYTATGRENLDFDPALAKAVSLANRRKYGADDHFDSGKQAQQTAGDDGDVMIRFRADRGMLGHKAGKMTDQGMEVLDKFGRLIGHYR
ncbi:MAG: hypothetical protein HXL68_05405 [Dechloromonas agitata]|uniref:Uncharacterized protein n=1 Tax=Dechloromonas agitata TaxID=73030 RepID=A0A930BUY7_9RHOO|nr:hypothetical protein [Dechloromonas agitata]